MSTPTPPNEPQPGWQQPYDNAPAAPGGPVSTGRPGQVTAAAIIGIVIGALGTLGGLLSLSVVFNFSALLGLLSLVSLVISIGLLVGGIQVIRGGSPQILLLAAYASIAINLIVIIYELASGYGFAPLGLLSFVLPILIVVFIRQNQGWFTSRGIK